MGEINGLALSGAGAAHAARLVARAAARSGVPVDVVELRQPVDDALAALASSLPAAPATVGSVVREPLLAAILAAAPTALIDRFRWRAWAAQAMGAQFVVCPDADGRSAGALAAMGLRVVDVSPDAVAQRQHLVTSLALPGLTASDLLAAEQCAGDAPDAFDRMILLRRYRELAGEAVTAAFVPKLHHAGAVVADVTGRHWLGLSLETAQGTVGCAEGVAISAALLGGARDLAFLAIARHPSVDRAGAGSPTYALLEPCERCREVLSDVAPAACVIVERGRGLEAVPVASSPEEPSGGHRLT